MNCEEFQKYWVDCLEKGLNPAEETEWQSHLHSCESCRREMAELQSLERDLKDLPLPSFPESFWSCQREAIRSAIHPSAPGLWERFLQALFQPRGILAGALTVLILFLGSQYVSHRFFKWESSNPKILDREESLNDIDPEEEDPLSDLTPEQQDRYYVSLAQRYLPEVADSAEEEDPTEGLTGEELNRVIEHFEQNALRRTL
jgi:hypothetical protein